MKLKFLAVAAVAAGLLATGAANAAPVSSTTTALGAAVVGTPLPFNGDVEVQGLFSDIFTFTLPANGGSGYSVTNFPLPRFGVNTVLATLSLFSNTDGILNNGDDTFLSSSTTPGGNSLALAWNAAPAGKYYIKVAGNATGMNGGLYNGAISVATVPLAPVPEPETYAMMLAGLGALGFLARRRRND